MFAIEVNASGFSTGKLHDKARTCLAATRHLNEEISLVVRQQHDLPERASAVEQLVHMPRFREGKKCRLRRTHAALDH